METLVLNAAYLPINRVSWMEAICDVVSGRAEVVETYDWKVHSAREEWLVPSVIRFLTKAVFYRRAVKFNRHNVWLRDAGRCQYCSGKVSKREFTYDHVVPSSRGGKTVWENIVVACLGCNARKRDRLPRDAGMRLIRQPRVPTYLPGQVSPLLSWEEGMPLSWRDYLASYRYWHQEMVE